MISNLGFILLLFLTTTGDSSFSSFNTVEGEKTMGYKSPKVDLGLPNIQAICRIQLENGRVEEGIISLGGGGYDYSYTPHGFCYKFPSSYSLQLFSLEYSPKHFKKVKNAELFFVKNISGNFERLKTLYLKNDTLVRESKEEFKLSKEFPIYHQLSIGLHVGYDTTLAKTIIQVDKIVRFDLLANPPKKWLNLIEEADKKRSEVDLKEEWIDYVAPAWYHEIKKDRHLVDEYMRYFPRL